MSDDYIPDDVSHDDKLIFWKMNYYHSFPIDFSASDFDIDVALDKLRGDGFLNEKLNKFNKHLFYDEKSICDININIDYDSTFRISKEPYNNIFVFDFDGFKNCNFSIGITCAGVNLYIKAIGILALQLGLLDDYINNQKQPDNIINEVTYTIFEKLEPVLKAAIAEELSK
jgi:hypothetical protein